MGVFPLAGGGDALGVAIAGGDEGLVAIVVVTFRTLGEGVEEVKGRNRGRKEDT